MDHYSLLITLLILMWSFVVLELYLLKSTLVIVEQFFCHCQMLHDMTKMVLWSEGQLIVPKAKRKNSRLGSKARSPTALGYETNFWESTCAAAAAVGTNDKNLPIIRFRKFVKLSHYTFANKFWQTLSLKCFQSQEREIDAVFKSAEIWLKNSWNQVNLFLAVLVV